MVLDTSRRTSRETTLQKIFSTDNMILKLVKEKYELNKVLNSTTAIMSIPLEMLTEIFCVANEDQYDAYGFDRHCPMPFVLGAVCTSWRQVVFSTPQLWCIITHRFGGAMPPHILHEKLELWLSRSKGQPLRISLNAVPALSNLKSLNEAVVLLLKESHRWRTFHLATISETLSTLRKTKDVHFPMLRSLRLDVSNPEYFDAPKTYSIFISAQLATLQLNGMYSRLLSLHWDSIETLRVASEVVDCLFLLRVARFTRTCHLTIEDNELEELPTKPCLHPNLSTLTVAGRESRAILNSITAPELRKLSTMIRSKACMRDFIQMIKRSSCHLVVLDITTSYAMESQLLDFLKILPSLSHLMLRDTLSGQTLDALNPSLARNPHRVEQECLPSLVSFEFQGRIGFQPETMLNMLNSRIDISKRYDESTNASDWPFQRLQVMRVKYVNPDWGKSIHPNILRDFYKALFSFGKDFDIELVGDRQ